MTGVAHCGGDLEIEEDSFVELMITRTDGCTDFCVFNVTAQRQLAIICPSPFCHYILYSYAAGQLVRPTVDNIYPLNGLFISHINVYLFFNRFYNTDQSSLMWII